MLNVQCSMFNALQGPCTRDEGSGLGLIHGFTECVPGSCSSFESDAGGRARARSRLRRRTARGRRGRKAECSTSNAQHPTSNAQCRRGRRWKHNRLAAAHCPLRYKVFLGVTGAGKRIGHLTFRLGRSACRRAVRIPADPLGSGRGRARGCAATRLEPAGGPRTACRVSRRSERGTPVVRG